MFLTSAALLSMHLLVGDPAGVRDTDFQTEAQKIRQFASDAASLGIFDGVILVARGETILFHEAFGQATEMSGAEMTVDTRVPIASLSKQVTAAAIGRLVDDGLVTLDASVDTYLPDQPNANRFTVRQLLEHTAGVAHTNRLADVDMTRPMTLAELADTIGRQPLAFEPGTSSTYSNGGYALLAAIVESVTGEAFGNALTDFFGVRYSSILHVENEDSVPDLANGVAPGVSFGRRVASPPYVLRNRIGGGSLAASALDVHRFFRDSYTGKLVSETMSGALFSIPADGDVRITGRNPGALAVVYFDANEDLSVVTLSANGAWPAGFNETVTAIATGESPELTAVTVVDTVEAHRADLITGHFKARRLPWEVTIETTNTGWVYAQGEVRAGIFPVSTKDWYLPVWDWLCRPADESLTCRQRLGDREFLFERLETPTKSPDAKLRRHQK